MDFFRTQSPAEQALDATKSWAWHYHTSLAALGLFALWFLYQTQLYPRYFSRMRHLPGPPMGHSLWGQFPAILEAEAGLLQLEWAEKYQDERHVIRAVGPVGIERLFFTSPKAAQQILVDDVYDFPRAHFVRAILGQATGYGLLTVEGDDHRQMRRMMQPAFSQAHLAQLVPAFYPPIEKCMEILNKKIKEQTDEESDCCRTDVYEMLSHCTLDIICETAFGYDVDAQRNPDSPLAKHYGDLIALQTGENLAKLISIVELPFGIGIPLMKMSKTKLVQMLGPKSLVRPLADFETAVKGIKKVAKEMLRSKTKQTSGEEAEGGKDVLSLLVKANEGQGEGSEGHLNEDQMMDQVLTILGAGHETTATGMSWTLWLLSKHPEVQKKLSKECADLLGRKMEPTIDDLNSLPYLAAVVKESLRVMPPVPMTMRATRIDKVVDGTFVPAHTFIYMPNRVMNMLPELWGKDSKEFKPERWLDTEEGSTPAKGGSRYAFQSFIHGAHSCIGAGMAVLEMKAMICVFTSNYSFEWIDGEPEPVPKAAITMKPRDPLNLRIRKITTLANAISSKEMQKAV